MHAPVQRRQGYTLIELLVVLVIVGVLAVVGVSMLGNRPASSVRGVLDELEGTLAGAHALAAATGQDVLIATQGDWSATGTPLLMAYGNANSQATPAATITYLLTTTGPTDATAFRVGISGSGLKREHMNAGVVTNATAAWFATAGTGNQDLTGLEPFKDQTGFQGILRTSTDNLFLGGTTTNSVRISGFSQRFTTTFWIEVVGITNGAPIAGGPMGVLVGLANGSTVYKFYNPGITNGDGKWRKI